MQDLPTSFPAPIGIISNKSVSLGPKGAPLRFPVRVSLPGSPPSTYKLILKFKKEELLGLVDFNQDAECSTRQTSETS